MTRSAILSLGLFIALLALWEAFVRLTGVSSLVIPAPSAVLSVLWEGLTVGFLWPHIWVTAVETLLGFALGCVIGFLAGVALGEVDFLRRLLWPYVLASQVVPKLALGPIFIVWFGFGMTSTIVITALICFFPLLENTLTGLQSVPPEKRDLFRMLGASRRQTLLRLKIPSGLPVIMAGVRRYRAGACRRSRRGIHWRRRGPRRQHNRGSRHDGFDADVRVVHRHHGVGHVVLSIHHSI